MSEGESTETTAGGIAGRVIGKAKAAVGSLIGSDQLQREGNLQHAQSEAEAQAEKAHEVAEQREREAEIEAERADTIAERDRLKADLEAEERKAAIERNEAQVETEIAKDAGRQQSMIKATEQVQERAADASEHAAIQRGAAVAAEAARLERQARQAEAVADAIDPEEK
jgi:uncharacterized protein YjbJ (UPF0337 family)